MKHGFFKMAKESKMHLNEVLILHRFVLIAYQLLTKFNFELLQGVLRSAKPNKDWLLSSNYTPRQRYYLYILVVTHAKGIICCAEACTIYHKLAKKATVWRRNTHTEEDDNNDIRGICKLPLVHRQLSLNYINVQIQNGYTKYSHKNLK